MEKSKESFMGRVGVTLLDVEKAALQLQGRGKNPSVDAVREVLTTGSKATITKHLRDWKAQQSQPSGRLPQELLALVTGLWERLHLQADERINEIENTHAEQIQALKQTLLHSQQELARIKSQLNQLEETCAIEHHAKNEIDKQFQQEKQDNIKLNERFQGLSQQFEASKTENNRLHQLAHNIQANLEHYQHAMQQLRTEQTLAFEKQQVRFQQEITELQNKLSSKLNQSQHLENELNQKSSEIQRLQQQNNLIQQSHEKSACALQESSRELIIYKDRNTQYQQTIKIHEQELEKKLTLISDLEKQIAIQIDLTDRLQNSLNKAEDKVESLRQEKLFLIQEKSELQGYLKQMEHLRG